DLPDDGGDGLLTLSLTFRDIDPDGPIPTLDISLIEVFADAEVVVEDLQGWAVEIGDEPDDPADGWLTLYVSDLPPSAAYRLEVSHVDGPTVAMELNAWARYEWHEEVPLDDSGVVVTLAVEESE